MSRHDRLVDGNSRPTVRSFSVVAPSKSSVARRVLFSRNHACFIIVCSLRGSSIKLLSEISSIGDHTRHRKYHFVMLATSSSCCRRFHRRGKHSCPFKFASPVRLGAVIHTGPNIVILRGNIIISGCGLGAGHHTSRGGG